MLGDEMIQRSKEGIYTEHDFSGKFCKGWIQVGILDTLFEHLAWGMASYIDFVKCLQGYAARPGAGFHKSQLSSR